MYLYAKGLLADIFIINLHYSRKFYGDEDQNKVNRVFKEGKQNCTKHSIYMV